MILEAVNAPSARARLMMTRIGQKMSLLVAVKKKMVLLVIPLIGTLLS